MKMIMAFALFLSGFAASAQNQLDTAKQQHATAERIVGVDLKSYNCLITSIGSSAGKCNLTFVKGAEQLDLLASPEVAAIYANPTKYARAPFFKLTILVSGGEVLMIEDEAGERISKKIDYSR